VVVAVLAPMNREVLTSQAALIRQVDQMNRAAVAVVEEQLQMIPIP